MDVTRCFGLVSLPKFPGPLFVCLISITHWNTGKFYKTSAGFCSKPKVGHNWVKRIMTHNIWVWKTNISWHVFFYPPSLNKYTKLKNVFSVRTYYRLEESIHFKAVYTSLPEMSVIRRDLNLVSKELKVIVIISASSKWNTHRVPHILKDIL